METTSYGIRKTVDLSIDEADQKIRAALKEQGFGILTEIDVKATLKTKLDIDTKPYKILGACNPGFAHKALTAEPDIGLLLPCNVIVYTNDSDKTVVAAMDPASVMMLCKKT